MIEQRPTKNLLIKRKTRVDSLSVEKEGSALCENHMHE